MGRRKILDHSEGVFFMKPLAQESAFPAAKRSTYLDSASIALMYSGAAAAAIEWQRQLAEEGSASFDEKDEEKVFASLHEAGARLLNSKPEDIAIGSSETILMSSLAWGIAPAAGQNVVSTRIAHPSTIYPWVRVCQHTGAEMRWVSANDQYVPVEDIIKAIDHTTAVVCLSHVEYGAGQQHDLATVSEIAHKHGAMLIVDVTQSAGQIPIDVKAMGIDAAACSTYKWLCGPFGAALMYVSASLQDVNPGIVGWRSHIDMWDFQADRLEYSPSACRFEFSTMSYGAAIAACEAIKYLLDVSVEKIAAHNRTISTMLRDGLAERGVRVLSPENAEERSAIVAARFDGDNAKIVRRLSSNNVLVSSRGDFIRFSPHLFNGGGDIERALSVIDGIIGR
jgi:selenocysteine lyase/cysteine desulfurase